MSLTEQIAWALVIWLSCEWYMCYRRSKGKDVHIRLLLHEQLLRGKDKSK